MIARKDFVQNVFAESAEWRRVRTIAGEFETHMNRPLIQRKIANANQPGESSSAVQDVLLDHAKQLGFRNESKGLFKDYRNKRLRPDFFLDLDSSGIILEVERGKINMNNMDFLDFWKCHICEHAHYLFLMVPQELRQNSKGMTSKAFATTESHLSAFFEPQNYTNVRGLVLFGY